MLNSTHQNTNLDELAERAKQGDGRTKVPEYVPRTDGMGRPIPSICLKSPTGGGKTE